MAVFDLKALGRSPFLESDGGEPRQLGRVLLGFLGGLAAGLVMLVVVFILFAVAIAAIWATTQGSMEGLKQLLANMQSPSFRPDFAQTIVILAFLGFINTTVFGTIVVVAILIGRRRLKPYFTAAPRFRWRMVAAGLLLFTVLVGPVLAADALTSTTKPAMPILHLATTLPQRVIFVLTAVVSLVFAAGVEELLCRGWILRVTSSFTRRFWIMAAVNGLLFSAMHLPDLDPTAFVARALMGVGFCYMTLRTGGIEFSTGAHAANNILLILFVQPPPLTLGEPQPFSLTAVSFSLVAVAIYFIIAEIVVRWPALRRWSHVEVEPPPAIIELA